MGPLQAIAIITASKKESGWLATNKVGFPGCQFFAGRIVSEGTNQRIANLVHMLSSPYINLCI